MAWAKLEISDGTTTVNLITTGTGFHLVDWNPQIIQPKEGGVFQDSPIAAGRRLVFAVDATAIESFDLDLNNEDQNGLIEQSQDLMRLLNKARAYQIADFQTDSVWIRARAECEDNDRFALIINWTIPNLDNPYAPPFFVAAEIATMEDINLQLERGHWADLQPGQGTAIPVSALEAYNGINLGTVDSSGARESTTSGIYVANSHHVANVTHVYRFDSSAGTFSSNLMSAALPFNLFPSPAGNGDILYIGCDTAVADSGPFSNLIMDITQAAAGTHTIVWEMFAGGIWFTMILTDNTDNGGEFRNTGIRSLHWDNDASVWETTSINGVTAYWIRARISAFTSMTTIPQQGNRDIYSAVWGYAEIQAANIGGDIPALTRIKVYNYADKDGVLGNRPEFYFNRVLVGLRSYDRGENFRAYINLADEQNPSGITVTLGPDASFINWTEAPAGRAVRWIALQSTGNVFYEAVTVTIDSTLASEYYGTYHVFVRARSLTNIAFNQIAQYRLQVRTGSGGIIQTSKADRILLNEETNETFTQLLDFGEVTIWTDTTPSETPDSIVLGVELKQNLGAGYATTLWDLVLLPTDEWAGDCTDALRKTNSIVGTVSGVTRYIDIDSVSNPKTDMRAPIKNISNNQIVGGYNPIASGPAILQSNARQRLWILTARYYAKSITHTGANNQAVFSNALETFTADNLAVGDIVFNTTDGSWGIVTAFTDTTITAPLIGGVENLWDTGDVGYFISTLMLSDPMAANLVQVEAVQRYLGLRGSR